MKILVTGFEPFGGESRNPAAEILKALPSVIGGAEIKKLLLPVVRWDAPNHLERIAGFEDPDVILSLGQAGGRAGVSVERVAVNLDDYRIPDNAGNQPQDEPIDPSGPDAYLCTLPVKKMVDAIREEGIPAEVSLSAGAFVCNHVFYCANRWMAGQGRGGKAGFIHIPYLPEQVTDKPNMPSMSLHLSAIAVEKAIEVIAKES